MHRRLWLFKSEIILQAPPKNSWLRRDGSCDPWEHRKSFNYIVILQAAKVSTAEHSFVGVDMMGGGE